MDLRQLRYFVRIAEIGSFSRAAESLGLSQPALSRQVRLIEEEVEASVLVRTGRGVELTPAGACLLNHATGMIRHFEDACAEIAELKVVPTGQVSLGVTPTTSGFLPPGFVEAFMMQFPSVHLTIVEGMSGHIHEWIMRGAIDLAILPQLAANENIVNERLGVEELMFVCAKGKSVLPREIGFVEVAGYPLVLTTKAHAVRKDVDEIAAKLGVKLTVLYEHDSVTTIQDAIRKGSGYGFLPLSMVLDARNMGLFDTARVVAPELHRTLKMSFSPHTKMTPLIRELRSQLKVAVISKLDALSKQRG